MYFLYSDYNCDMFFINFFVTGFQNKKALDYPFIVCSPPVDGETKRESEGEGGTSWGVMGEGRLEPARGKEEERGVGDRTDQGGERGVGGDMVMLHFICFLNSRCIFNNWCSPPYFRL